MKKIILAIILVAYYSTSLLAQQVPEESRHASEEVCRPRFLDRKILKNAARNSEILNRAYENLKRDTAGAVFQYTFTVDHLGKVILNTL